MQETLGEQLLSEQHEADESAARKISADGAETTRRAHGTTETAMAITASLAVAAGVAAVAGELPHATPNHPTPIEQTGSHQGIVHISGPGEGILNTKTGNFRITQNGDKTVGSIGSTAPQAEIVESNK